MTTTKKRHFARAILIIGSLFRLRGVPVSDIWYDEAFSLAIAKLPLLQMIRVQSIDFNPPLWEMILWPVARITGSVLLPRLMACAASVAALYVFWLIMDALEFTDNQHLWAAVLAAFLPGHLLVAQDARVYALLTLLIMAATLFAIRGRWLALTAIAGLMLYSHTTSGAFLAGIYLLAWYKHPAQFRRIIISGVVAIVAWIPWIPTILATGQEFWLGPLTLNYFVKSALQAGWAAALPTAIWQLAAILLMIAYFVLAISVTVVAVHLWLHSSDKRDTPAIDTALIAVVPLALMVAVSMVYANLCFYRPLTLFLLPFALWIGAVAVPTEPTVSKMALPVSTLIVLAIGLIGYSPAMKGAGLAAHVRDAVQPGDVVVYVTGTAALPAEYHLRDIPHTAYILDADQHPALLRNTIQDALGYTRARLGDVRPDVILYPQDPLITDAVQSDVAQYLSAQPIGGVSVVNYWQAADIFVYRLPRGCGCGVTNCFGLSRIVWP